MEVVYALTARNALNRDWKGLCDYIGFTSNHIQLLEEHKRSDKAWLAFKAWSRTGRSSLRLLVIALRQLGLESSLRALTDSEELRGQIDFAAIFAELEQLKARGEDKIVQTELFPRFGESDIVIYDEMLEEEEWYPKAGPSEQSSVPAESPQPCSPPCSQSPLCTPPPARKPPQCSPPPPDGVRELAQQFGQHRPFRENPTKSETFFISYYPESKKHKQQVASLVQQLRAQGYTVFFDELCKQDIKKSGGLTRWKESCIHSADNIVVVCSPKYYREDEELSNVYAPRRKLSKRHVAVDTHLLRDIAYSGGCGRLIPVVVGRDDPRTCTPLWLQSHVIHRWPHDKVDLLRFITGTPKYELPPVVKKIDLKPLVINFPEAYDWDPYDEEPPSS